MRLGKVAAEFWVVFVLFFRKLHSGESITTKKNMFYINNCWIPFDEWPSLSLFFFSFNLKKKNLMSLQCARQDKILCCSHLSTGWSWMVVKVQTTTELCSMNGRCCKVIHLLKWRYTWNRTCSQLFAGCCIQCSSGLNVGLKILNVFEWIWLKSTISRKTARLHSLSFHVLWVL